MKIQYSVCFAHSNFKICEESYGRFQCIVVTELKIAHFCNVILGITITSAVKVTSESPSSKGNTPRKQGARGDKSLSSKFEQSF